MTLYSVFLVDDHPVLLHGMADLIATEPAFKVIGTTGHPGGAFEMIERLAPDIVVLDINMPEISGLALLRQIRKADLAVKVVFLTATITPAQVSEALDNGIWGLLLKESAPDTLLECLRSVANGEAWLPAELVARAVPHSAEAGVLELETLTPRELEIVECAARGLSNKLIAQELSANEGTVKVHMHNIFQKLGVTNRTALAALYFGSQAEAQGAEPS